MTRSRAITRLPDPCSSAQIRGKVLHFSSLPRLRGENSRRSYNSFHEPGTEARRTQAPRSLAEAGGGKERQERQHKDGKMSARERIEFLLDEGTFEEFDKMVTHKLHRLRHGAEQNLWRRLCHRLWPH